MKRPRKTIFSLLGIAASVGLASGLYVETRSLPAPPVQERQEAPPPQITVCPTPAPKKPLREGYRRDKCRKCGQEYDAPIDDGCIDTPLTKEEEKHLHWPREAESK